MAPNLAVRRAPAEPRPTAPDHASPQPTLDHDAIRALAWIESGMPDDKVGYGPDVPKLTPEQLQEFAPASYVRAPTSAPGRPRVRKAG